MIIYVCRRCTHFELQYLQCYLATLATSDLHLIEPTFSSYPQVCNQHSTSKQFQKHFHSLQLNTILYVLRLIKLVYKWFFVNPEMNTNNEEIQPSRQSAP